MTGQNKWNEFFILYNEGLADAYDTAMESYTDEAQMRDPSFHEQVKNHVLNSMQAWYGKSYDRLDGKTPEEMIDSIATIEDMTGRFKQAAVFCDDEIPEYLKIKLGSFGGQSLEMLEEIALTPSWEGDYSKEETVPDAEQMASAAALKLLGEWQSEQSLHPVLAKFIKTVTPHELLADAFKSFILGIGEAAIPALIDALNNTGSNPEQQQGAFEYLIIALTLASTDCKSEETYSCLRSAFRSMPHKVIGAICIGDYGDPRGISLLKGYLDRNKGKFDRQEFYEILSSIKRLGGDISDVDDPFRDFSAR